MACSELNMAEVIIVRECKYGQVRVCFGNVSRVEGDVMVLPANNRLLTAIMPIINPFFELKLFMKTPFMHSLLR